VTAQVKVVVAGHVDHGKSTLIGRLMHDTGSLPEGKLEQLRRAAERRGVPFEWANLMDALQAERDQNITIDTAQIWFRTARRQYVLIDAPGHREFIKNMVTGAAAADAALLVIDASEGVQEQSRRHGSLLALLGIRQVAVLVNKMDLQGYREEAFGRVSAEYQHFLTSIGIPAVQFVPVSARYGENVAAPGASMPWWSGGTVVDALDRFTVFAADAALPLRFAIQDVYRFDERRLLAGRVESGTLRTGDRLLFCPDGKTSSVKSIERWNVPARDMAEAGESVAITLTEQIFVERGSIAALEAAPPYQLTRFKARVLWLGREPLRRHRMYRLKLMTQEVDCDVEDILRVVDAASLEELPFSEASGVGRYDVADIWLRVRRPVAFDAYSEVPTAGRFVLVDGFEVSGGGIVLDASYPRKTSDALHRGANIFWTEGKVSVAEREGRNGHPGMVVWLTGLPASGKSTLAMELERALFNMGRHVYVLDGDNVRHGLCADLGFSADDRSENIRRVGEVAKLFADAGQIVLTAFISPLRTDRDLVRRIMPAGRFIEVYVNAPLDICELRDSKGLYAKARAGEIADFTGISAPYEAPEHPDLELQTDQLTIDDSVAQVLDYLSAAFRRISATSSNR
jgi:bifunctional enzyme CysN/CysC